MSKLAEELATVEHNGRPAIDTVLYAKLIKYGQAVRENCASLIETKAVSRKPTDPALVQRTAQSSTSVLMASAIREEPLP